jgi:hypothetical protein
MEKVDTMDTHIPTDGDIKDLSPPDCIFGMKSTKFFSDGSCTAYIKVKTDDSIHIWELVTDNLPNANDSHTVYTVRVYHHHM